MQDFDLKQADLCSYFKVIIFLTSILIFWIFAGWLADYSLPLGQIILLLGSAFQGKLGTEFNHLQKKFQDTPVAAQNNSTSPSSTRKFVRILNSLDAQAQLYVGILDRLKIKNANTRSRIVSTVIALQSKRSEVLRQLEPNRPQNYQKLATIQQNITNSFLVDAAEDYAQLNRLVVDITKTINNSRPSEAKENLLNKISSDLSKVISTISPSRAQLIYQLEDLFKDLLTWGNREIKKDSFENSIDDLTKEINELGQSLNDLFIENWNKDQELESKAQTIDKLEDTVNRLCFQVSSTKQELNQALNLNHQKQTQLDNANQTLRDLRADNSKLQYQINTLNHQIQQSLQQKSTFEQQIQRLNEQLRNSNIKNSSSSSSLSSLQEQLLQVRQERDRMKSQIQDLREQVNALVAERFSGSSILGERRRSLSGKYIGNLSNLQTKYHFHIDCPIWWSLVGQYLYGGKVSGSRKEIVSSDNSRVFREAGLQACEKCREL